MIFMLGGLVALVVILLVVFIPSMEKYTKDGSFLVSGRSLRASVFPYTREGCETRCDKRPPHISMTRCMRNCGGM